MATRFRKLRTRRAKGRKGLKTRKLKGGNLLNRAKQILGITPEQLAMKEELKRQSEINKKEGIFVGENPLAKKLNKNIAALEQRLMNEKGIPSTWEKHLATQPAGVPTSKANYKQRLENFLKGKTYTPIEPSTKISYKKIDLTSEITSTENKLREKGFRISPEGYDSYITFIKNNPTFNNPGFATKYIESLKQFLPYDDRYNNLKGNYVYDVSIGQVRPK